MLEGLVLYDAVVYFWMFMGSFKILILLISKATTKKKNHIILLEKKQTLSVLH